MFVKELNFLNWFDIHNLRTLSTVLKKFEVLRSSSIVSGIKGKRKEYSQLLFKNVNNILPNNVDDCKYSSCDIVIS